MIYYWEGKVFLTVLKLVKGFKSILNPFKVSAKLYECSEWFVKHFETFKKCLRLVKSLWSSFKNLEKNWMILKATIGFLNPVKVSVKLKKRLVKVS